MRGFQCDIQISRRCFDHFKEQYLAKYPDFKGTIRQSDQNLWIAEVIDESDNLKTYETAGM